MNVPQTVRKIEGINNCIEEYTSVGSYLNKFHRQKVRMMKRKKDDESLVHTLIKISETSIASPTIKIERLA